jgi:hypothetical protein
MRQNMRIHPKFQVLATLAGVWAYLTAYALGDEIQVAGIVVEHSEVARVLRPPRMLPAVKKDVFDFFAVEKMKAKPVMDTTKKTILLTGDSMSEGLLFAFLPIARRNGHAFYGIPYYGSTTKTYALSDTLPALIRRYRPDYILFTLGGNELFIRRPQDRAQYVRRIKAQAGSIPMIWIGTPNWKRDTGLTDVIRGVFCDGDFFDSSNLTLPRTRDGAHPTRPGSTIWADSIRTWIMRESRFPIELR